MNSDFRGAVAGDIEFLLEMMRALYQHDDVPFDEARSRRATLQLMQEPQHGGVLMIEVDGAPAGYLVVTFAYSLEFGGSHGFIDELFVAKGFRGRGIGTAAVHHAAALCTNRGMMALLLEADIGNERATQLYRRLGFVEHRRRLMTRLLQFKDRTASNLEEHGPSRR